MGKAPVLKRTTDFRLGPSNSQIEKIRKRYPTHARILRAINAKGLAIEYFKKLIQEIKASKNKERKAFLKFELGCQATRYAKYYGSLPLELERAIFETLRE